MKGDLKNITQRGASIKRALALCGAELGGALRVANLDQFYKWREKYGMIF
jgi:hypothetical protein